jgi:hypothetical protein
VSATSQGTPERASSTASLAVPPPPYASRLEVGVGRLHQGVPVVDPVLHHVLVRQDDFAVRIEPQGTDQAHQRRAAEALLVDVQRGPAILDHDAVALPADQPPRGLVVPAATELGIAWKDEPHHVVQIRISQPPDQGGFQHVVRRRRHRAECAHLPGDEPPGAQWLQPQHACGGF